MGLFVEPTILEQLREQEERLQALMRPTVVEQLQQHEERLRLFLRPTILEQLQEQQERMRALTGGPVIARQLHELQLHFGALADERLDADRPDLVHDERDGQGVKVDPLDATTNLLHWWCGLTDSDAAKFSALVSALLINLEVVARTAGIVPVPMSLVAFQSLLVSIWGIAIFIEEQRGD
jgi:hypothetical protein